MYHNYWVSVLIALCICPQTHAQMCEPTLIFEAGSHAHASAQIQDVLYIANGRFGISVVDVSDIREPRVIGQFGEHENARSVEIDGDTLYVGGENPELVLYDISDPVQPVQISVYKSSFGRGEDIELADGFVYLTGGNSTQIISVEDQFNPVRVGYASGEGIWNDASVNGNTLYVAAGFAGGVRSYSIVDRSDPVLLDRYTFSRAPRGIETKDDQLYVVSELDGSLRVFDALDPGQIELVGSVSFDVEGADGDRIDIVGNVAYITTLHTNRVLSVDISAPTNPMILDIFDSNGPVHGVRAETGYVVVTKLAGGVEVLDTRDPSEISLQSYIGFSGRGTEFVEYGEELLFMNEYGVGSIRALDEPPYTEHVRQITFPGYIHNTAIAEHLLIGAGLRDVWIVDLSQDSNKPIGHYSSVGLNIVDIAAYGSSLYITRGRSEIEEIDFSNPSKPVHLRDIQFPEIEDADQIIVSGGLVFLNSSSESISVLYPENPDSDAFFGGVKSECFSCSMTLQDEGVLYAGPVRYFYPGGSILQIDAIDVSDPRSPYQLPPIESSRDSDKIHARGAYLASVSRSPAGLELLNVSDPNMPVIIGGIELQDAVSDVRIIGDRVYVAGESSSRWGPSVLRVFDLHSCDVQQCAADITGDGVLDAFDIFAFIEFYNALDPVADFTGEGTIDIFDVFAFIDAFNAGCPAGP